MSKLHSILQIVCAFTICLFPVITLYSIMGIDDWEAFQYLKINAVLFSITYFGHLYLEYLNTQKNKK